MRLITFLGTGNYSQTCYIYNSVECQTRYIAAALATFLQADSVMVLATEQAHASHAQALTTEMERLGLPIPNIRQIPSGGTTEELWKQFEVIRTAVMDGNPETVSFDITHGFRAQPFFAAAVINYLRATLETVPAMQAFYGEWRQNEPTSPVWDISAFINLLDWSSALQSFMKTGNGAGLAQLAEKEDKEIRRSITTERPKNLTKLARCLKAFSENIATVRVAEIIIGKRLGGDPKTPVTGSAKRVLELINASEKEVERFFKPLHPVLAELKQKLKDIPADDLFSIEGYKSMLELAKLYVDYERYPEAAIVLREGWISVYSAKDKTPEELLNKAEREKSEHRWYENEAEQRNLDGCADLLSSVRNDIQHGGFRLNPSPADKLVKNLNDLIEKFSAKLDQQKLAIS